MKRSIPMKSATLIAHTGRPNTVKSTKIHTQLATKLPYNFAHSSPKVYRINNSFNRHQPIFNKLFQTNAHNTIYKLPTIMTSSRSSTTIVTKKEMHELAKELNGAPENEADREKLIQAHYAAHHTPIGFPRQYGAPYTDVKILETLPLECYSSHLLPRSPGDKFAKVLVEFFKLWTRVFFRNKYTHHAVVLETVAAVPGMVAGMFRHLRSLRRMERDHGWIGKLLEEAENERMHLLTWMQVVKPTFFERLVVLAAQAFYTPFYAVIYLTSPTVAHRFVGYLEETAVEEYTHFLHAIDRGEIVNVDAPEIAKLYWNLPPDAKLRDVVLVVRADEAMHRDVNHTFSKKSRMGLH